MSRISKNYQGFRNGAKEETAESGVKDHHRAEKEEEIKRLKTRFVLALAFGLPIIYMVMGEMLGLPLPMIFENYGMVYAVCPVNCCNSGML